MSSTEGGGSTQTGAPGAAERLGFKPGMVIQELGWDSDTDDQLRVAIEDAIDADMVDSDYGNVVDAVVLWWRSEDGDLVDGLVDVLTDLVGGGGDLAPHAQGRAAQRRRTRGHRGSRADRRPVPDHHSGGEQGVVGHQADRSQDPRLTRAGGVASCTSCLLSRCHPRSTSWPARQPRPGTASRCWPGSGIPGPYSPLSLARAGLVLQQWGTGPAGGFLAMATLVPDRVWVVDERGDSHLPRGRPAYERPGPGTPEARGL